MELLVEGINHRVAPLEVRERVYVSGEALRHWLRRLAERPAVAGGAILSTCNRTEFYVTAPAAPAAGADLAEVIGTMDQRNEWERYRYRLGGGDALAHMFRVASGMESAIIGEAQVLGQFKAALGEARQAGSVDGTLDFVMRRAITAAKRVRTETAIGRNPVGFGHAAAEQARAVLGSLEGRAALLVGAGKMAGSTARVLASRGVTRLYFSTRTPARAVELAEEMPAGVVALTVPYSRFDEVTAEVDLIVCSTSSPDHVFNRDVVRRLTRGRRRPLFLLDLAVPRDVDPAVGDLPGVHLFNIDDLGRAIESGLGGRISELPRAETIVADEVRRAQMELARRGSGGAVAGLVAEVERLRREQLAELARTLDPVQLAEVDRATQALAGRLLHGPITRIHESEEGVSAVEVVRELFGQDPGPG